MLNKNRWNSLAPYCCDKTLAKSNLGRTGFVWLAHPESQVHSEKLQQESKLNRNLEAGPDTEAMGAMLTSLISTQEPPVQEWHHPQWAGVSRVNH
ncbi:hypothetical protein T4D_14923 [Trichinella pseudospiralis]|uniref:Uncharacterized protein n=1 Tax=Trichinella pseudospiralis TaxID=6337 RepID=A0A0V1E2T7_TRIPS|nr:hypothetical protein T4D_14923 [Trichinella pseudospiralis]